MRILIVTLLLFIICPLADVSFADERSDCLDSCANDKNMKDSYCPPADGNNDEDFRQCIDRNNETYNSCNSACPTEVLQSIPPEEPVTTDKQD